MQIREHVRASLSHYPSTHQLRSQLATLGFMHLPGGDLAAEYIHHHVPIVENSALSMQLMDEASARYSIKPGRAANIALEPRLGP